MIRLLLLSLCMLTFSLPTHPQSINPQLLTQQWQAQWIAAPGLEKGELNVSHYRRRFNLEALPAAFVIHISADTRYKLYVNGRYIGQGPANNDLLHYSFDTYDIATQLQAGDNVIAVEVVNFGDRGAIRFHTKGTALIVQGNGQSEQLVNTSTDTWKSVRNAAYTALAPFRDFEVKAYYAVGTTEKVDAALYPWNWQQPAFDDSTWLQPTHAGFGYPFGYAYGFGDPNRTLSPRTIPKLKEEPEMPMQVRTATGVSLAEAGKLTRGGFTVPAHTKAELILDQGYLTKGFPVIAIAKGKGAVVSLQYTEALYGPDDQKGNRNEIDGKRFIGNKDVYLSNGGDSQTFSTLWYRTWRYVKLEVQTADEPVVIKGLAATRYWYPFEMAASFDTGQPVHKQIWDVGWRTALLCSDETYMDCPYYEQLQYIGDTRIQAFISLYVSGDDRLMRNAIEQFYHSITNEGITQSRYPSQLVQLIPTYSLFWVNMIYDYHMLRNDDAFTAKYLSGIASVIAWFEEKLDERGILGPLPWWSYLDWVERFPRGSAPGAEEGGSVVLSLQLVYTLQDAAALFRYHGQTEEADRYDALAQKIRDAVNLQGFDAAKGLYADTPDKTTYSQHTNIFAILTNTIAPEKQSELFKKIVSDTSVTACNVYFRFYLTRAAQQTGNGDYFIQNMSMWENMLKEGLTTFAEQEGNTRSDCHAWSASPNYEFLATVAGILPAAPHFARVSIAPNPGNLKTINAKMPHPQGEIVVKFEFGKGGRLAGTATLPMGVTGELKWKEKTMMLKGGENKIDL